MPWPTHPVVLEMNTWTWLDRLRRESDEGITLATIPQEELERLAGYHPDAVWLMGVWERSPHARAIALRDTRVVAECREALPGFVEDDLVGSPYSIRRYVVDAHLGGDHALEVLRGRLQRLGIGLVLDFVPNHLAPDHPWVDSHPERFVQGSEADLARDPAGYIGVRSQRGDVALACGRDGFFPPWQDTVQLDYRRGDTRVAMTEQLEMVSQRCDGLRCDMAMLLTRKDFIRVWGGLFDDSDAEFWPSAIERVRGQNPDFAFIAEAYWIDDDDRGFALQAQGFDFTYDERLYKRLNGDPGLVADHLQAGLHYQRRLVRFIENHDEPRAVERFGRDASFALATLVLTLPGMRLVHDGQAEGYRTRVPVQLGRQPAEPIEVELAAMYRRLLDVLAQPVLRHGSWHLVESASAWGGNSSYRNILASQWGDGADSLLVAVNLSVDRSQCYLRADFSVSDGDTLLLSDRLGSTSFRRSARKLRRSGLFLDLPGFGCQAFSIGPASDSPQTVGLVSPVHASGLAHRHTIDWQPTDSVHGSSWDSTFGMAWSPDNAKLALSDLSFHISIWDGDSAAQVSDVGAQGAPVTCLTWSPDGRSLASGSNDATIAVWDLAAGARRQTISGHEGPVLALDWSPTRGLLASGSMDRTVRIWDTDDGYTCELVASHADSRTPDIAR